MLPPALAFSICHYLSNKLKPFVEVQKKSDSSWISKNKHNEHVYTTDEHAKEGFVVNAMDFLGIVGTASPRQAGTREYKQDLRYEAVCDTAEQTLIARNPCR